MVAVAKKIKEKCPNFFMVVYAVNGKGLVILTWEDRHLPSQA